MAAKKRAAASGKSRAKRASASGAKGAAGRKKAAKASAARPKAERSEAKREGAARTPTGQRARDPGKPDPKTSVEARVRHVMGLMSTWQYETGKTDKRLAEEWGLHLKTVQVATAEASRRIKAGADDLDAAGKLLALCIRNVEDARGARRFEAVNGALAIAAKITGAEKPTKHQHTGADGGPIDVDARVSLLDKLASIAASAAPEGGAGEGSSEPQ